MECRRRVAGSGVRARVTGSPLRARAHARTNARANLCRGNLPKEAGEKVHRGEEHADDLDDANPSRPNVQHEHNHTGFGVGMRVVGGRLSEAALNMLRSGTKTGNEAEMWPQPIANDSGSYMPLI